MGVPPAEEEMAMETVCPSSAPEVVPAMETEPASAALRTASPPSLMATVMAGAAVSTEKRTELLRSEPSLLVLPAASENAAEPTEIRPSAVLLLEGEKEAE